MTRIRTLNDLESLPIVDQSTAETLAEVRDVIYDGPSGSLHGFRLQDTGLFHGERAEALPWSSVQAVGDDAVVVEDRSALSDGLAAEGGIAARELRGAELLLPDGDAVGTVQEVFVDVDAGVVVGYGIEAGPRLLQQTGPRAFVPLSLDSARDAVAVAQPDGLGLAVPWPEAESQARELARDLHMLAARPLKELRRIAREAEIEGRSKMTKEELIQALVEQGFAAAAT